MLLAFEKVGTKQIGNSEATHNKSSGFVTPAILPNAAQ